MATALLFFPYSLLLTYLLPCELSDEPWVELLNVKGLTVFLVFNINNITTTGLPNNNS